VWSRLWVDNYLSMFANVVNKHVVCFAAK
jgi:hypothetical protein